VASMKVTWVCMWSGVNSFRQYCWEMFLKQKQTDEMVINIPEFVQSLTCNCWTDDYTLDQPDAAFISQITL
jgi:hypothetical protein